MKRNPEETSGPVEAPSRREFLAGLGSATALLGWAARGSFGEPEPELPEWDLASLIGPEGPDWEAVRECFGLRGGLIYLNNGTLGPCSRYVMDQTFRAWWVLEENPAEVGFGPLLERMEKVRHQAAEFLGCSPDEIVITRNTTEGMNTVAQGLHLQPGQRVLTTDHEHPGGSVCWEYFARRSGIEIDRLQLPMPPQDAREILSQIDAQLTPATRVISVSHVTFSTGLKLPLREIAAKARANGALLVVDGAQAPGVLNVNVKDLGCHTYATSAHKWMLAPKGTGILYLSEEVQPEIDALFLQHGRQVYTASTGTRNVPAIVGLGAAMEFLNTLGKESVQNRALALRGMLYEGLSTLPQLRVVSPPPGEMASALVTFALPEEISNEALAKTLKEKHDVIVKVVPRNWVNGIRVSAHVYNREEEVERLLTALRREL